MSARFRVNGAFALRGRPVFVVHGEIVEGTVRPGQRVLSPAVLDTPVRSVESLTLRASEGIADVALVFDLPGEATLARWTATVQAGMEMQLAD